MKREDLEKFVEEFKRGRYEQARNKAKPGTLLHGAIEQVIKFQDQGIKALYLCIHPDTAQRQGEDYVNAVAEALELSLIQSAYLPTGAAFVFAEGMELDFSQTSTHRLFQ